MSEKNQKRSFTQRLFNFASEYRIAILAVVGLLFYVFFFVIGGAWRLGYMRGLENIAYNYRFEFRGAVDPHPDVVMLGVESSSFKLHEQDFTDEVYEYEDFLLTEISPSWPWDRSVFARTLEKLIEEGGAELVIFDLLFMGTSPGDPEFKAMLEKYQDKVVLVYTMDTSTTLDGEAFSSLLYPNEDTVLPDSEAEITGFANVDKGEDEIVRKAYFQENFMEWKMTSQGNIDMATLEKLQAMPSDLTAATAVGAFKLDPSIRVPDRDETLYINYAGPPGTYKRVPVEDLFLPSRWEGRTIDNGKFFEGKTVIIGAFAEIMKDYHATPYGTMPGPEIHANQIANLFDNNFIQKLSWENNRLLAAVIMLLSIIGYIRFNHVLTKFSYLALLLGAYLVVSQWLFAEHGLVIPVSGALVGIIISGSFALLYDFVLEQYERTRIRGMFGTYVSPEVVSQMIESGEEPQLGGVEQHITCFFSDVASFSSFSEVLSPTQLVEIMNEYLTAMTDILHEQGGTLDKYIGDAIVAMYGAPIRTEDHAYRACYTAHLMQKRQAELREMWEGQGDKWPNLLHRMRTRIGLNTGLVTVGNMGSKTRFNYTFMGDNVNLAARCESGAKSYGVYTMVTQATVDDCRKHSDEMVFRFLDKIVVKGRSQPVDVYELISTQGDMTQQMWDCLSEWEKGIEAYFAKNWNGALAAFENALTLEPLHPKSNPGVPCTPSDILIERCHIYKDNPPPDPWDGVFVMKTK